jgi:hypothetical protein
MLVQTRPDYQLRGERVPPFVGVWISGWNRHDGDCRVILPLDARPGDWRAKRAAILAAVAEVLPTAALRFYRGGVARFEWNGGSAEAHVSGYRPEPLRKSET